eukprot:scaffold2735_cov114-Isochrysis_galbana.AAC.3
MGGAWAEEGRFRSWASVSSRPPHPSVPCQTSRLSPVQQAHTSSLIGAMTSVNSPRSLPCSSSAPKWAARPPTEPRASSSCSLVSSRAATSRRSPAPAAASSESVATRRCGASYRTTAFGSATSSARRCLRARPERGRKPPNRKPVHAKPETDRADTAAQAPGIGTSGTPAAAQRSASTAPGSEMPGVPASLTTATVAPSVASAIIRALAASALCSWYAAAAWRCDVCPRRRHSRPRGACAPRAASGRRGYRLASQQSRRARGAATIRPSARQRAATRLPKLRYRGRPPPPVSAARHPVPRPVEEERRPSVRLGCGNAAANTAVPVPALAAGARSRSAAPTASCAPQRDAPKIQVL